jgi:hypothetical protein
MAERKNNNGATLGFEETLWQDAGKCGPTSGEERKFKDAGFRRMCGNAAATGKRIARVAVWTRLPCI